MKRVFAAGMVFICMLMSSCSPGRLPGPTITPTPTIAPAPTNTPTLTYTPTSASSPTQTLSPTPAPPTFIGKIIAMEEDKLFELSASTNQPTIKYTLLASDVTEAVISPDFSQIAYTIFTDDFKSYTHLYNLVERTEEVILEYGARNIAWSPDSQYFGYSVSNEPYVNEGLYLFDVKIKTSRLLYEPPCAAYGMLNNRRGVCGAIQGTSWISDNVMVFQRFKGAMPQTISSLQLEIPADTTTLVFVNNGSQTMADSPRRWQIQASCADKVMLRDEADETTTRFYIADTADFIASYGSIEPVSIKNCLEGTGDCASIPGNWTLSSAFRPYFGLLPNSCSAFYFSGDYQEPQLHILTPDTQESRSLHFPVNLGMIAFPSDYRWTANWPEEPEAQIALMPYYHTAHIEIINLQTAGRTTIWEGGRTEECRLLAWIAP